jgi:DNA-directed RNA polymerase alpha subunit
VVQAWDFVNATVLWQKPADLEFLAQPVAEIDWTGGSNVRIRYALQEDQIETVADLMRLSESELMRMPNFGSKSLAAIKDVLSRHGLELKPRSDYA